MKNKLFLFAAACLMTGCLTKIQNGIVPAKYLAQAQAYTGNFTGELDGQQSTLTLSIDAAGKAHLALKDQNGTSNVLHGCALNLGNLQSADVNAERSELQGLNFSLAAAQCAIAGDEINLEFSNANSFDVEIVKTYKWVPGFEHCHGRGEDRDCEQGPDRQVPDQVLKGSFQR